MRGCRQQTQEIRGVLRQPDDLHARAEWEFTLSDLLRGRRDKRGGGRGTVESPSLVQVEYQAGRPGHASLLADSRAGKLDGKRQHNGGSVGEGKMGSWHDG